MVSFSSVADRAMAAKKQFYAISSEYGSTRAGQWAHYFAALCEVDLGNYAVAEGQLKDVAKSRDMEVSSLGQTRAGFRLPQREERFGCGRDL